ncbi:MAG: putative lipid II flippase FtsW [Deltaproteobacteria bacterium]|nr:putative lipid II flippase FtsW [Deltaproteobacteria bacterium]
MTYDDNTIRRVPVDVPLLIAVALLTSLGLTFVFSASAVLANDKFGDNLYFLKRMILNVALGVGLMMVSMRFSYFHLRKVVYPFMIFCVILLLVTLYSGLGVKVGSTTRWISFYFFNFQPSELAKIAIIFFMAYFLEKKEDRIDKFSIGIIPPVMMTGVLILLVLLGKDFGTAFVMGLLVGSLLFLGGARLWHLFLFFLAALPMIVHLILNEGYRMKRLISFLNPWGDRLGGGFQILQSLLAFDEGGWTGKGLGAGQQKLFYLPEAHTDFIFSVVGEELGLFGVTVTIGLFIALMVRGIRIARHAPDLFGRYVAFGIVLLVILPCLINMGVATGLLPTKGLVLPFLSYGGSNMVTTFVAIGILLNISTYQQADTPPLLSRHGKREEKRPKETNTRVRRKR